MKTTFNIIVSSLILLIFFPFGIIISFIIVVTSRGGVFYVQQRVGRHNIPFGLIKFRTMLRDADKQGKLTVGMRDPRITRIGYFLRKSKLDEFPQFINVLSGKMSIVGPRPEVREYVDLYTEAQLEILTIKPGITDYASLEYFRENELLGKSVNPEETYIQEVMPAKIELNKKYLENPSIGHDLKIMWRTLIRLIR